MHLPRCVARQDQSLALCRRGFLQTTVAIAGENADLEEINNALTNSAVLRALTSLIGGCVETNVHRCAVVWCLSVSGCGSFRGLLSQRQLLLLPLASLHLGCAVIAVFILVPSIALCVGSANFVCLRERAPNNSILAAYPQVHHRHLAEISVSKHLVAVDSAGR
jgi:hypothetical protein